MPDNAKSVVTFPARPVLVETVDERCATSLAVIRSAAEILRDVPDLAADDRARFAAMILAEEGRLERRLRAFLEQGVAA